MDFRLTLTIQERIIKRHFLTQGEEPLTTKVSPDKDSPKPSDSLSTTNNLATSGGGTTTNAANNTTKVVPNNQVAKLLPAKPLPADSYKNNLLKAKAEEGKRAEMKAAELPTANRVAEPSQSLNRSVARIENSPECWTKETVSCFMWLTFPKLLAAQSAHLS